MMMELQRAAERGFRPGADASTENDSEIRLISFPYTNGHKIFVLGRIRPDDPASWAEFNIDELALRVGQRTPAVPDEQSQTNSSKGHPHEP